MEIFNRYSILAPRARNCIINSGPVIFLTNKPSVAVLGSGAAGATLAAYLISKGLKVNLFELPAFAKNLKPFQESGGIEVKGAIFSGFFEPKVMTTEIKEALKGVNIAMMTVPAYGHEAFAKTVMPNLESGQILLNWTSYWFCLRFADMFKEKAAEGAILSEGRVYPFMTRRLGPALVYPDAMKAELSVAAMPSKNTNKVVNVLKKLFPGRIVPASNVLQTALENINVSVHTAPTLLNTAWWEKTQGDLSFYEDLISPGVGRVLDAQDKEKIMIGRRLGLELLPGPEIEIRIYSQFGVRGKTFYEVETTMESHKAWRPRVRLNDPTNIIWEDIPYGLVPMSSLGDLLGVPTPTVDALIHIASLVNEVDYWKMGLTVEKLGLNDMTAKQILNYVTTGEK